MVCVACLSFSAGRIVGIDVKRLTASAKIKAADSSTKMNIIQRRRLIVIISLGGGLGLAVALILYALSQNIHVFYTPSQLKTQSVRANQMCRVGGMVVKNSVVRKEDLSLEFMVTDFNQQVKIKYRGVLPDLFREGQGIVALGKMSAQGEFIASQVLAKHDEKYMPPEIAARIDPALLSSTKKN